MATVTPIRAGTNKPLGEFKAQKFSMFDDEDLVEYARFRNEANDPTNGIKLEMMREYSRKTTTIEDDGENRVTVSTEEIILVVHYWENPKSRRKADNDDDLDDGKARLVPVGSGR